MAYGCFVDIRQQDGSLVRMNYYALKKDTINYVNWIGIMEQMADKFKGDKDATDTKTT